MLSGGNFHAEPVAFAADVLALACVEIGSIAERRVALLVDPKMSGLPAFLAQDSGVNSGFMMAQVTAAALVAENRMLSHPASVDSIPTSANQEDHVSMATHGARRVLTHGGQHCSTSSPSNSSPPARESTSESRSRHPRSLQQAHDALRAQVPFAAADRLLADDIEAAARGRSACPPIQIARRAISSQLPLIHLPDVVRSVQRTHYVSSAGRSAVGNYLYSPDGYSGCLMRHRSVRLL